MDDLERPGVTQTSRPLSRTASLLGGGDADEGDDSIRAECRPRDCPMSRPYVPGSRECRTGEGGLGARALVPAEGVELFCFQALYLLRASLRLVRGLPIELGIVVIYIITAGNKMTPR